MVWDPAKAREANKFELQRQSACSYATAVKLSTNYPTRYEMLQITNDEYMYNYALVINPAPDVYITSSLGSFDSADGEYLPSLVLFSNDRLDWPTFVPDVQRVIQEQKFAITSFNYPQDQQFSCTIPDYRERVLVVVLLYYFSIKKFLGTGIKLRPETAILDLFEPYVAAWQISPEQWKKQTLVQLAEFANNDDDSKAVRCGVKVFPLRNIHNVTTLPAITPWNEIFCLQLTNQLRRRFICPFFPQYYGNAKIANTNVHLFQNQGLLDKFNANADAVAKIARLQERLALEQDELAIETLETMKQHLEVISVLSGECAAVYLEHVSGWSFWLRRFSLIERSGLLEYQTIMFCLMYALFNLGLNHILHSDLHLGNVLIESSFWYKNAVAAHRFLLPKPSPELQASLEKGGKKGGGAGPEPLLYEPELALSAQIKLGKVDLEPKLAPAPHGTFVVAMPALSTHARIIDFSRALVLEPSAFSGIQAYRAEQLEQRNKQLYALYLRVCDAVKKADPESVMPKPLDALQFMAVTEEMLEAVFRTLEGGDFFLYLGHALGVFPPLVADKEFATKNRVHLEQLRSLFSDVYADLAGLLRSKLELFHDVRYDLVASFESVYPALIHKHCALLHNAVHESTRNEATKNAVGDDASLLSRIFRTEKNEAGVEINPHSPNHTRLLTQLVEYHKKKDRDPAPYLVPRWGLSYSCVAGEREDVPQV